MLTELFQAFCILRLSHRKMTVEQILFNWVPAVYLDVFGDEAIGPSYHSSTWILALFHLIFPLCVIKRGMGCA